ncbi:MAG: hypothetical protein ACLBM1_00030 [Cuspidothrix sp.]
MLESEKFQRLQEILSGDEKIKSFIKSVTEVFGNSENRGQGFGLGLGELEGIAQRLN